MKKYVLPDLGVEPALYIPTVLGLWVSSLSVLVQAVPILFQRQEKEATQWHLSMIGHFEVLKLYE
ncbi:hypothetical protein AGMMS49928_03070 [Spirochaetia bacterium]|nr:hypothetical protein AGMMS49928_03070 [Spirochaetia bacterium]